jgi:Domain of unknown function (DUF4279)
MSSRSRHSDTPAKIHLGGEVHEVNVQLVLYAAEIDPDAITAAVGHPPTEAHRRGDPIGRRKRPAPIGLWSLAAPERLSFAEQVSHLLEATTPAEAVWAHLATDHDIQLRSALYLHSWNEGFSLGAATLTDVGRRGWSLGVSIYGAEGEEILDAFLTPARERIPDH